MTLKTFASRKTDIGHDVRNWTNNRVSILFLVLKMSRELRVWVMQGFHVKVLTDFEYGWFFSENSYLILSVGWFTKNDGLSETFGETRFCFVVVTFWLIDFPFFHF
jgi:hypothetical protein